VLPAMKRGAISLPRVVELVLVAVPTPRRSYLTYWFPGRVLPGLFSRYSVRSPWSNAWKSFLDFAASSRTID